MNEYYGTPTTPMNDYLVHWGTKGMKWGVRKKMSGKKKKARKYFTKDDFKDAFKAAGLSVVMGPSASYYVASRREVGGIKKKSCKK